MKRPCPCTSGPWPIREKALGPEHPATAISLSSLAVLYEDLGAYDQALPLQQRALKIYEKALGPEHPDTASQPQQPGRAVQGHGRL